MSNTKNFSEWFFRSQQREKELMRSLKIAYEDQGLKKELEKERERLGMFESKLEQIIQSRNENE